MQSEAHTIVIVGGVAGGASAATRARRMNEQARIILFEKDEHVSFANCGMPYYLGGEIEERDRLLVATPQLLENRFGIETHVRHEVLALDRQAQTVTVVDHRDGRQYQQRYDRLILAPGASPFVPELPGLEAPNVFTLRNLLDMDRIDGYIRRHAPRRAIVVGAGFIGLEMAEQLHRRGLEPVVIELADQVLAPLDREMAKIVEEELTGHGVALRLRRSLRSIRLEQGRAVAVELTDGEELEADLVLMGIGVRPNTKLAVEAGLALGPRGAIQVNAHGQTSDPHIYAVGDAVEVVHGVTGQPARIPLAGPANRAGRLAGEHAATGDSRPVPPALGTAIVRVFALTAAATGLSEKEARRQGQKVTAVYVEGRNHASYFPGAQAMVLKLIYDPESGRVLGAQAVGGEGVDKRIDVIATAIHFGATVEQLTELDLNYAPPFGSAKDPVHMAAFVASNQRAGLVTFLPADTELEGRQLLDVRGPAEFAGDHIPGAVNIPLDDLRGQLEMLDRSRDTVLICRSGLRGYYAARILKQSGFERVRVLSGGMIMRPRVLAP